mgnify:CR=1 FL=1
MTAKEIVNHVVDLDAKPQLIVYMPMTKDMAANGQKHTARGADANWKSCLIERAKNDVFNHSWLSYRICNLHLRFISWC